MEVALKKPPQDVEEIREALDTLWKENPEIKEMLSESKTLEEARGKLLRYLKDLEWKYRSGEIELHKLDYAQALESIKALTNIISPRNERLAGFSTLEILRKLGKGELVDDLEPGFVKEFIYAFRGAKGRANFSKGWIWEKLEEKGAKLVDFSKIKGRAAGIARSNYLDKLSEAVWEFIKRHPSGLDEEVIEKRKKNREKILSYFGGSEEDWYDYRWHIKHIIRGKDSLKHLKALVPLTKEDEEAIRIAVENDIPFGITPYYLSLFDFERSDRKYDHQVRSQVIPPLHYVKLMSMHKEDREYYFDFMGEHDTSPIELVTRRYPMIAILKPYDTCPQICVYCQRNWEITGPMMPGALPPKEDLNKVLDWYENHPHIKEVLITGGDPFVLGNSLIKYLLDRLAKMNHIIEIRWGTRTPVTLPMRITDELADLIGSYIEPGRRNICVVTHVESAYEITPETAEAVMKLRKRGIYVYNQLVYTLETSRRFQNVAARIAMKLVGIDPYYTFYPKGKEETKDYLVPVARIWQERKEEARLLPGQFRTDEPVFNVPRLGKNHIRAWQDRELLAIYPNGRRIYMWHPWEKGVAEVEPFIYWDTSIDRYLKEMEKRGEDIKEYETIWYYY
ncbi:MAG: KamA family radical SAM protein [Synergistetes bacterium]|nr:KamA family radical SAM protein [Synergistota bacterium]